MSCEGIKGNFQDISRSLIYLWKIIFDDNGS